VLGAALEQVEANAPGTAAGDDPEFLHQLRVGTRRLRSALQAFRPLLPKKPRKRAVRALRKLTPALGGARDWDVLVAWLESAGVAGGLLAEARARQAVAQQRAVRALASRAWRELLERSRAIPVDECARPLQEFAAQVLERAHRKVTRAARGIDWDDASERHALRVRLKRLRYTCDFLSPAFAARAAGAYIRGLKRLQDVLGELNDVRVGRELLANLKGGRAMHRRLGAREANLLGKLAPAWRAFERRAPFWEPRGRTPRRAAT
jgi:triphosphatase